MAKKETVIFANKYKPKSFEEAKLPERINSIIKTEIDKFNTDKSFKLRLLLHGSQGTGKTTTSRIIQLLTGAERLFLSGSNDFTINTMREKVYPFCQSYGNILGTRKILIIDEFERIQPKIQDAFKVLMDETNVGIILTTNHFYDVIKPIHSRCRCIDYNYTGTENVEQFKNYVNLMVKIIKENSIKADSNGLEVFCKRNYPDFRQGIEILQQFYDTDSELNIENLNHLIIEGGSNVELYELFKIMDDATFFNKASEYKGRELDTFLSLGNPFFIWLNNQNLHKKTIQASIIVGNWGNKLNNAPNKWIALFACLCELRALYLK